MPVDMAALAADLAAESAVTRALVAGLDEVAGSGWRTPTPAAGWDIADQVGVGARAYSYAARGKTPPGEAVRVELSAPDGTLWTWGPAGVPDRVTGTALDFCLLVTQRRHPDDLDLAITGPAAREWMAIAQAFAGPPGPGREPARDSR